MLVFILLRELFADLRTIYLMLDWSASAGSASDAEGADGIWGFASSARPCSCSRLSPSGARGQSGALRPINARGSRRVPQGESNL